MTVTYILRIDNNSYVGEIKDGKPHGKGKLSYRVVVTAGHWFKGKIECHYGDGA